jgi:monothiol glutaredoxin
LPRPKSTGRLGGIPTLAATGFARLWPNTPAQGDPRVDLDTNTREKIDSLIQSSDVMLFMKGNREAPQCGFSATVVGILDSLVPEYNTADVLQDAEIRNGIKSYSSWPTIPQLYVKGEFVGGCDIIQELFGSGELHEKLGVDFSETEAPELSISPAAVEELAKALDGGATGQVLHLAIDARFQNGLSLGPAGPGDISVQAGGLELFMDRVTAGRANGLTIDVADTPEGRGFAINNPNAPEVNQLTVQDLKAAMDRGDAFELFDVRTPEERAQASINGSHLLGQEEAKRIEGLPKNTMLVFHCHHGGRSQQASEHYAAQGFTNVHNVVGGIHAWSEEVDSSVPQY